MKNKNSLEPNELSEETKVSMRTRIITALVLLAICGPCLFLGGWPFFLLSVILSLLVSYELVHVFSLKTRFKYLIHLVVTLLVLAFIYWIFIKNNLRNDSILKDSNVLYKGFNNLSVSTVLILVTAGALFGISFICEELSPSKVFYLIAMIIVVSLCFQSFLYLRFSPNEAFAQQIKNISGEEAANAYVNSPVFKYAQSSFLMIYVLIGTMFSDIGAYFVGVLFGKHKVNPRISPKKTWEGFYGGIAISFVCSTLFALITSWCGLPILPNLDHNHWYWILLISALMPIFANLGDFTFSAIKRGYGIKDFSNILPGHGGILDRLDSVLFVSGFVAVMLIFINNGWNFLI